MTNQPDPALALSRYVAAAAPAPDALLKRLEDEARAENIPITGIHEAALLHLIARLLRPDLMVELGTATGFSGIWLLRGWDRARLITFESDPVRASRARQNFAAAGLSQRVEVREENAVEGLERLGRQSATLLFNDLLNGLRDEERVALCFHQALAVLRPGGVLFTDNALASGEVAHPQTREARCVHRWNELVGAEPSLVSTILPIGDGLSMAVRS